MFSGTGTSVFADESFPCFLDRSSRLERWRGEDVTVIGALIAFDATIADSISNFFTAEGQKVLVNTRKMPDFKENAKEGSDVRKLLSALNKKAIASFERLLAALREGHGGPFTGHKLWRCEDRCASEDSAYGALRKYLEKMVDEEVCQAMQEYKQDLFPKHVAISDLSSDEKKWCNLIIKVYFKNYGNPLSYMGSEPEGKYLIPAPDKTYPCRPLSKITPKVISYLGGDWVHRYESDVFEAASFYIPYESCVTFLQKGGLFPGCGALCATQKEGEGICFLCRAAPMKPETPFRDDPLECDKELVTPVMDALEERRNRWSAAMQATPSMKDLSGPIMETSEEAADRFWRSREQRSREASSGLSDVVCSHGALASFGIKAEKMQQGPPRPVGIVYPITEDMIYGDTDSFCVITAPKKIPCKRPNGEEKEESPRKRMVLEENNTVIVSKDPPPPLPIVFKYMNEFEKRNFPLPSRQTRESAGYDVYLPDDVKIEAGATEVVPLGIGISYGPSRTGYLIMGRSSLVKYQLRVILGLIDSDFKDMIFITMQNYGYKHITLERGTRVCQIVPFCSPLNDSPSLPLREGGCGSTGKGLHDKMEVDATANQLENIPIEVITSGNDEFEYQMTAEAFGNPIITAKRGSLQCTFRVNHFIVEGMAVGLGKTTLCTKIASQLKQKNVYPLIMDDCLKLFCPFDRYNEKRLTAFYGYQAKNRGNEDEGFTRQCIAETMLLMAPLGKLESDLYKLMQEAFTPGGEKDIVILLSRDMFRSTLGFAGWNCATTLEDIASVGAKFLDMLSVIRPFYNELLGGYVGGVNLYSLFKSKSQEKEFLHWGYENMMKRARAAELEVFTSEELYQDVFTNMEKCEEVYVMGDFSKTKGETVIDVMNNLPGAIADSIVFQLENDDVIIKE